MALQDERRDSWGLFLLFERRLTLNQPSHFKVAVVVLLTSLMTMQQNTLGLAPK
jgi:hypothetical protein